jgi:hypothetical protein
MILPLSWACYNRSWSRLLKTETSLGRMRLTAVIQAKIKVLSCLHVPDILWLLTMGFM